MGHRVIQWLQLEGTLNPKDWDWMGGKYRSSFPGMLSIPRIPLGTAGFSFPVPQKTPIDFFSILVHSLPFYSDVSGLGFYSFLIAYTAKEDEFSLQ